MFLRNLCFLLISLISYTTFSQQRSLDAVKVTAAPKLDGKLDEAVWQQASPVTDFIVNNPSFGTKSVQRTEVRIIYDNEAVYIGAILFDDPKEIRRQLTSRDAEQFQDVDNFHVAFDPYNDNQNAFQFIVTSANVQSDVRISPIGSDYNWDAIWDSRTSVTSNGWIAEIKIPYMALRFPKKDLQDWGINFSRFIRRVNEQSHWSPVDPKVNGYVNQFGDWKGLKNLEPPLRLSFLPYVSAGYRDVPTNNGPIRETLKNGGMDVKWGINESFTLDMTLIPDFGQVQSDNVILNLSPFEQQFNENRPFFTEGTELFNKAGIFYSRRVGAMPGGYFLARRMAMANNYRIIKNPSITQLYNATKFSGRTKKNLGIGVFNAVTAPMHAEMVDNAGNRIEVETEPLTNYNIIVLDQALKNRSFISFTNTNVIRNGAGRDANVSALDASFFDKKNTYNVSWSGRFSHVTGARGYNGYKSLTTFQKVSGKWQYGVANDIESENYDPNDLGFLAAPNKFVNSGFIRFQQFTPNKLFNYRRYNVNVFHSFRYAPFHFQDFGIRARFLHVFKNFWDVTLRLESNPVWYNDFFELRRPGLVLKRAPWKFASIYGSSDSRKKLFIGYGLGIAETPIDNDPFYLIELGMRYRFSPKFSLNIDYRKAHDKGNFGFVGYSAATGVPIIGKREVKQVTTVLSAVYNFKPRMNLTMRARHYWSPVNYISFHDVQSDGYWKDRPFIANQDRNANIFNMDMFFTWDFRLGSRLIVAWKNALGPDEFVNGSSFTKYAENYREIMNRPHSNELSVKCVYFIDYNKLRKKKS